MEFIKLKHIYDTHEFRQAICSLFNIGPQLLLLEENAHPGLGHRVLSKVSVLPLPSLWIGFCYNDLLVPWMHLPGVVFHL